MKLDFVVVPNSRRVPSEGRDVGYLWVDNWNDWFKYRTLYVLTYFDKQGGKNEIGNVKIGQFQMAEKQSSPDIPDQFTRLENNFFSLGQDSDYYSHLMDLDEESRIEILVALRDIVFDESLYQSALEEDVTGISLLRYVNTSTVEGQFRRILGGGAILTDFHFRYLGPEPKSKKASKIELEFDVTPDSKPPTNIHVLIGRNGVGKTHLLNSMTRALVVSDSNISEDGAFSNQEEFITQRDDQIFANLLSISFSAFDDFKIVRQSRNTTKNIKYINVGLRKRQKNNKGEWITITRDPEDLASEFSSSARLCLRGAKSKRWKQALQTLESDPLFAEAEVAELADVDDENFGRSAGTLYRRLSSGHKIVLLTITKLVEHVEEKTLVLMDEPEAHLHPPLLAAFIRALSDLLINRNGVAVIATHSPVVLQEVPRSCVWKLTRHGVFANATRPRIETFAESIGNLTSEVFGLEVTRSGFHKMLLDAAADEQRVQDVTEKFDFEVGSEGRALISGMIGSQRRRGGDQG